MLVLLNKEKRSFSEDYDQYAYPFDELGWKYNVTINAIVRSKKAWELRPSLLKYNIEREGIEIL